MSIPGVEPTILEKLVKHDNSTVGAMVSRELTEKLSLEQRIALAGEVARARCQAKGSLTEVYRNAAYIANPLIMQIVRDSGYPVGKDKLDEFFRLGKEANEGSENAKKELVKYINNIPSNVIQTLLPMYHDLLKDVEKESKEEAIKKLIGQDNERLKGILKNLGVETKDIPDGEISKKLSEILSTKSEEEVKQLRLNELKFSFMGSVAFAFVEQRAFEMDNKQEAQK